MTNSTRPAVGAYARRFLLAFAFAAVIGAVAMPSAYAQRHEDHRRGDRHEERHDRDWGGGYRPYGGVYVAPQPYYQPYGYYDPPPVVYGPPAPSVGFSFVFP